MRRIVAALLVAGLTALSGCASVAVERGKDLSTAGIAYSKASAAVVDLAIDAAIDSSSYKMRSTVASGATTPERTDARIESLKEKDEILVTDVRTYAKIKRSLGAIEAYFTGLQELSGDAVEASVKGLADRVNGVSTALQHDPKLTDPRKNALGGFAKFLVKEAHGAAVARALERDADMIGKAMVLQEIALQVAMSDIKALADEQWARFRQQRLEAPFGAGGVGDSWIADRKIYVKGVALGSATEGIKTAEQAAHQMQDIWGRILSGKSSGAEFNLMLKDLNEALDAANALKKAF